MKTNYTMIEGLHAGHSMAGANGDVNQVVYQSCQNNYMMIYFFLLSCSRAGGNCSRIVEQLVHQDGENKLLDSRKLSC